MRLRYTARGRGHIEAIRAYIAEHDAGIASRIVARIRNTAAVIGAFPFIGHTGTVEGTREMIVPRLPFLIVYHVDEDAMIILGVYHFAQEREN